METQPITSSSNPSAHPPTSSHPDYASSAWITSQAEYYDTFPGEEENVITIDDSDSDALDVRDPMLIAGAANKNFVLPMPKDSQFLLTSFDFKIGNTEVMCRAHELQPGICLLEFLVSDTRYYVGDDLKVLDVTNPRHVCQANPMSWFLIPGVPMRPRSEMEHAYNIRTAGTYNIVKSEQNKEVFIQKLEWTRKEVLHMSNKP